MTPGGLSDFEQACIEIRSWGAWMKEPLTYILLKMDDIHAPSIWRAACS
jgi:hypothetical protein